VRIVEGNYDSVRLDGVEYVWAADECTGGHNPRKPTTLYFSRSAAQKQIAAVENIMTGDCSYTDSRQMAAKRVDLTAGATGSVYSVRAPMLRLAVDLAPGPLAMEPLPALDSWSNTVTYARNITASIDDPEAGLKWDYSGRQANYRTFEMTSELLQNGLMLAAYRDDSGRFNEMHRQLIRELHLEVPLTRDEFQNMLAQVRGPAKPASDRSGRDASGAVGGTVYGADGQPRSGARIRLTPAVTSTAVSNAAGRYFMSRVPPGAYQMCASSWDGQSAMEGCAPVAVKAGLVLNTDLRMGAVSGK
jgi:hypothetical protein